MEAVKQKASSTASHALTILNEKICHASRSDLVGGCTASTLSYFVPDA